MPTQFPVNRRAGSGVTPIFVFIKAISTQNFRIKQNLALQTHRPLCQTNSKPDGFALVITLTLTILLVVVAVSLLSLASISLRAGGQNMARSEVEANARLALMLALGELQQSLGPDQSVTAPSGIFDENLETVDLDGLKHRHLTGVWQALNENPRPDA